MATSVTPQQLVIVLDFGAQYGQLIARRVRDLGVYSEIVPCDITADEVRELAPSAIILSGGPASVYAEDAPSVDAAIFELGIPVLGFCYGQQAMAVALAVAERALAGRGACRVHGGGFAGTIQAFVPLDALESFSAEVEAALGQGSCRALSIRPVGGTRIA